MAVYLDRLTADMKAAMKAGERARLEVVRMLISDIKKRADAADGELSADDEVAARVRELAAEVGYQGPKDTGRFMKEWMARYKGLADGKAVQQALKALG